LETGGVSLPLPTANQKTQIKNSRIVLTSYYEHSPVGCCKNRVKRNFAPAGYVSLRCRIRSRTAAAAEIFLDFGPSQVVHTPPRPDLFWQGFGPAYQIVDAVLN
jgi:hypothetical protein